MNQPQTKAATTLLRRALCATTMLTAGLALPAQAQEALPSGGAVAAGDAAVSASGSGLRIDQSSSRAVINWNSFSVGAGKTVEFRQPDAKSATLNRVLGTTASAIAGQVSANGAVYLVNPNGIAITESGSVDVGGGFVATTLDIADADFMAGKASFTGKGASGRVSNAGRITAGQGGYVALLGGSVANSGTITVPLGQLGLGSGESIALDINGSNFLQVAVPSSVVTGSAALIDNSGTITVAGGAVSLKAAVLKDAVRNVINMSGSISADSAVGSGGTIHLIGGADTASMAGQVTVSGSLSARATGASGDGGFIETSGAKIDLNGVQVSTASASGKAGTWLIDPTDFTIAASGGDITGAQLSANLAGGNITILSSSGTSGTNGDINVNDAVSWSSGFLLNLSAQRHVNVNAAITSTGASAGLLLRADNTGTGSGTVLFGSGGSASLSGAGSFSFIYHNPDSFGTPTGFEQVSAETVTVWQLVNSLTHLQAIGSFLTGNYALNRDIDASATATWNSGAGFAPIGDLSNQFTGKFDGQGHEISGLVINRGASIFTGLFGVAGVGSELKRLRLSGMQVNGFDFTGGLVGLTTGTISEVSISGTVTGRTNVGGLVAQNSGLISKSSANVTVSGAGSVGGLVGVNSVGTVTTSSATGVVTGLTGVSLPSVGGRGAYAGGLVGENSGQIIASYATGLVKGGAGGKSISGGVAGGTGGSAGGLVGVNAGSISASFATGNATGGDGGDGGRGRFGISGGPGGSGGAGGAAGGLVGTNQGTIANSYATGSAQSGVGGDGGEGGTGLQTTIGLTPPIKIGGNGGTGGAGGNGGAAGGLVGENRGSITNVLAIGGATSGAGGNGGPGGSGDVIAGSPGANGGTGPAGGLVGLATAASTVSYAHWDKYSSGIADAFGVSGGIATSVSAVTSDPAQWAASNYAYSPSAYSFSNGGASDLDVNGGLPLHWRIYAGNTYPLLKAFLARANYVTASPATFEYDATTRTLSGWAFVPAVNLAKIYGSAPTRISAANAGVYYPTGLYSDQFGYDIVTTPLTITPRPLTVTYTANPASRLFGDSNPAFTGSYSQSGLVNGDTLGGAAVWSSTAVPRSDVGSYAITGSGLTASSNYALTSVQAPGNATALTITQLPVTIYYTAFAKSVTYGDALPALGGSALTGGFFAGDLTGEVVFTTTATSQSGVGSYAIVGSGLTLSSNYLVTVVQAPGNATALTINPRAITVTADALSRYYGDANPALTYTVGGKGLVNGDTLSGALATSATVTSNVGDYAITQGTLSGGSNYTLTYTGANLSVTPRPLTVTYTATPVSRPYGDPNPLLAGSYTSEGLVGGDTLGGSAVWETPATVTSNVGSYAITGSGLTASSNYALTSVQDKGNASALTITPRALTVIYTANPVSRTYGDANPALSGSYTSSGLVNGDTLSGFVSWKTPATIYSPVGSHAITGSGLEASSNYAVTSVQAKGNATALTITPRAITINAYAKVRTYGDANPALTYWIGGRGLANGDRLSGALATSATTASNVGTYAITQGSLVASSNYAVSYTGADLTILPRPLTITYTANAASRTYGDANPALGGSYAAVGLVNGDTLGGAAAWTTTATSATGVGSYRITGSGLTASANYRLSNIQAAGNATALTINPRAITITADDLTRYYGSPNPTLTYTIGGQGLVNGDTLVGALGTSATPLSAPGIYAITRGSLWASPNYVVTFIGAKLTIIPR